MNGTDTHNPDLFTEIFQKEESSNTVEQTDAESNVSYTTETGKIEPLYIQYNGKKYVYDRDLSASLFLRKVW